MYEWFLKSIGVTDELLLHFSHHELAFQHPGILWGGLLLVLPVGYYIYRRQRQNLSTVSTRLRVALSVTRIFILVILVLVLASPYLKLDLSSQNKPVVALLFDRSQSMDLPAGPFESDEQISELAIAAGRAKVEEKIDDAVREQLKNMSRAELSAAIVRSSTKKFLDPLLADYDVRVYSFARNMAVQPLDLSGKELADSQPKIGSSASHLGDAVLQVFEDAAGRPVSGIVLFSDGQNTGGRSVSEATRAASSAGTPIFAIPVGSVQRSSDVSIVDVYTSGLVSVGDTVRVAVTLESHGFDGKPVKVELLDGKTVLDSKDVALASSEQQRIELTFEAKVSGARYLTVNVPPLPDEPSRLHANNSDTAFVRISDEKLKILFVDGMPRWDFRFLKNSLRRDHGLAGRSAEAPDIVLEREWRRLPDEQKRSALPQTMEEISEYHTIILGDVSPELLNSQFQTLVIEAVRDKGVGLIVQAGPQFMPHSYETTFLELLPVRISRESQGRHAEAFNPFRLEITPSGVMHETMRLYDDSGRNQDVWGRMPPFYWCADAKRPAAAASVLAWNPAIESRFGKMPLIAYQYAGEGKVMFVGTDSTWLWRQNVGDRFFYKFWGQSIRFVSRKDESAKKSWIEVRPIRAQPGEQAEIELRAFDKNGSPRKENKLPVTIFGPESKHTVQLLAVKSRPGSYLGKYTPMKPGEHHITFRPFDGSGEATAKLRVVVAPEEFRYPNLNKPTLELLASTSGGEVIALTELDDIPAKLTGETTVIQLHREASVWDNWLILLVLMLVYSLDVGIRRLMGLS